jgi:hypothetical protein
MMPNARPRSLVLRLASALAVTATLTGSLVVSCAGDPMSGAGGGTGGSNAPSSSAMGRWTPATQDTCTKAFHDSFFVIGPDGKKYPTWHRPEEVDPATGQRCSFGHDHGIDPRLSTLWPDLQRHFAFDADRNGLLDASELDASGIPFGLAAEQLANSATPRPEDHTGYKIVLDNGVPRTLVAGGTGQTFELACDLFAAYNQPTSTEDAFASNMFSVTYAVDCNSGASLAQYPVKVIVSTMAVYGDPGAFTLDANGTQQPVGTTPVPPNSPPGGGELGRRIPTRADVFAGVFVASGQTSDFDALAERWETRLRLRRANGTEVATLAPAFRVKDPARYYDNGLARSVNLCYFGLDVNGNLVTDPLQAAAIVRQARGTVCSAIAPNGPATPLSSRVAFDDPASPFNACERDGFFGADVVRNAAGPTLWYTDAFGGSASPTSFANSIKQYIASVDTGAVVLGEARANQQGCQAPSVHAPN